MRGPAASFGGALGAEMMSGGGRQASGEAISVPKPTRYNVDGEARLSESPPSGSMLGSQPPTFFKMPSKYYALVGRSAVQDASGGVNGNVNGDTVGIGGSMDVTAGPLRGVGLRRVASEALFRIGTPTTVPPTGRPSNVLTGVDVTPHYDAYASVLPGASSHGILSHFSQQSAALAQSASPQPQQQQQTPSAGDKMPAAVVTAAPAVAQKSQPAAAAQQSSLLSRGASLLSFFSSTSSSPATSPSPSPAASPRPPADSAVPQPSAPAAAAAGAPGKLFFSRISSPELLSAFSAKPKEASGSSRRRGRGVNAKDLNALTPMDM